MPNPINFDPNLLSQLGQNVAQSQTRNDFPISKKQEKRSPQLPVKTGGEDSASAGDPIDTFKTELTPLIDGKQIFPKAREMIRGAKDNIAIELYSFGNADVQNKHNVPGVTKAQHFQDHKALVNELISAKKRGVDVQVLLDQSRRKGGKIHNEEMAQHLKANGIDVLRYPKSKASIAHVKLLVVDDKRAMIGGMNWGVHSPVNRDGNILIEGREAVELKEQIFNSAARFSGGKPKQTELNPDREDKIKVLTTQPEEHDGGSETIKEEILKNINGAKKSVHAELFCLTHKDVVKSLKDAHNRGVDVKVMLDPNLYIINRKAFYELKDAGVPVKWFKVDVGTEEKLHGKWATFDGERTIIGSANWSKKGLDKGVPGKRTNREANVLVRDEESTSIFEKTFNYDWENRGSVRVPPHMRFG
ncbi:MAG: phosphatidylserine/phosphatidylglycerophosphate/cardiolipin synthase family protein [Candidatus Eremiobacteraeota bacterium]|nr:phosphatidylserine/phosphatidylglycerophosphate/cardiolipin synthase family protein [Candidatus Eremiobacteraeota bacterium]